jgi:hypothetical protein
MSTKNNPGNFDCYANAEPDEPMFVLLARDEQAPKVVRTWVHLRKFKRLKETAGTAKFALADQADEKEHEALACADAMEKWRAEHPKK